MKRFWKIVGITLGSLIGVLIVAICVALWVVFTPERLTPIVRQVADKVITCGHEVGEVELTFFSTFPEFGLRAEGLYIIHPMEGAQSDTLLAAPEVVATVDVQAFLRDARLVVRELTLRDAKVNAYMAADGKTNFDVFALSGDTTTTEDTTAFALPFQDIEVNKLSLQAQAITLLDKADSIEASLYGTSLAATINGWDDILLVLSAEDVNATLGEETYAQHLCVSATLPAAVDLDAMHFTLREAHMSVNEFTLGIDGEINIGDSIALDLRADIANWQIVPLRALLPRAIDNLLTDLDVDGQVSLSAAIQGLYAEGVMPVVDASLSIADGRGKYAPLPYTLRDVALSADAHIDLNDSLASRVTIHALNATTKNTHVRAKGNITELLGDMRLDVQLNADVSLPDMAYFLPTDMAVNGGVSGDISTCIRLSDLTHMRLERGTTRGDLHLRDITYAADSLYAALPNSHLRLQIPNPTPSQKSVGWIAATLRMDSLAAAMTGTIDAHIGKTQVQIEAGNVLSEKVLCAAVNLQSDAMLTAAMDSMDARIISPVLRAYAEYDSQDSTAIPTLNAEVKFKDLQATYTNINAHLAQSSLSANLRGTRRDKSAPRLKAMLSTTALQARMGEEMAVETEALQVEAAARYNSKGENLLLQWNPRLNISLTNGVARLPEMLPLPVYVPQIQFAYSNKLCHIEQSQIRLGNSDFALSGEVKDIGGWLRKQKVLEGELNFVSDKTDANELLALFSADSGSEEEAASAEDVSTDTATGNTSNEATSVAQTEEEPQPFLVPTNVDLALNTHIKEAHIFDETAHDLKGRIYIRNGILVLEEVGFICDAARMQLTAMYKTPRRNHIYVGMDYHMLDVDIAELIHLIPQIDSMMPMLRSFKGKAEFHLAAETFTNAHYQPKPSTLRGAASLFAKDLVVLDSETFSKISKLLLFNKKTENKIDSLSAEVTLYKKEIDVYPLCVSLDNYMVALGGRHNLDMTFNYDINVLSPIYLGVNVSGNLDDLKIKLAKCKYAQDFKPHFHRKVDTQTAELRAAIRKSMQRNVKE